MANVPEFMNFLKSRSTSLKQKSADWVCAKKIQYRSIQDFSPYEKVSFRNPENFAKKESTATVYAQ